MYEKLGTVECKIHLHALPGAQEFAGKLMIFVYVHFRMQYYLWFGCSSPLKSYAWLCAIKVVPMEYTSTSTNSLVALAHSLARSPKADIFLQFWWRRNHVHKYYSTQILFDKLTVDKLLPDVRRLGCSQSTSPWAGGGSVSNLTHFDGGEVSKQIWHMLLRHNFDGCKRKKMSLFVLRTYFLSQIHIYFFLLSFRVSVAVKRGLTVYFCFRKNRKIHLPSVYRRKISKSEQMIVSRWIRESDVVFRFLAGLKKIVILVVSKSDVPWPYCNTTLCRPRITFCDTHPS